MLIFPLTITFMNCLFSFIRVGKLNGLQLKAKLEKTSLNFLASTLVDVLVVVSSAGNAGS